MAITVIHGPAGSGKTRNMEALMRHYGCKRVIDDVEPGGRAEGWRRRATLKLWDVTPTAQELAKPSICDGDLVLVQELPVDWISLARFDDVKSISIEDALAELAKAGAA